MQPRERGSLYNNYNERLVISAVKLLSAALLMGSIANNGADKGIRGLFQGFIHRGELMCVFKDSKMVQTAGYDWKIKSTIT